MPAAVSRSKAPATRRVVTKKPAAKKPAAKKPARKLTPYIQFVSEELERLKYDGNKAYQDLQQKDKMRVVAANWNMLNGKKTAKVTVGKKKPAASRKK